MAWVKLDDAFHTNHKAVLAGLDGRALYIAGLCWCARNLTDGYIDKRALPTVAALAGVEPSIADTISAVDVGLWVDHGNRYHVPDYLDFNPSRQQVIAEREAAAERKRRSRATSRRDTNGTDAVTSAASSPSPIDKQVLSSTGNSRPGPQAVDDDVSAAVWERYADLKLTSELRRKPGSVSNETSWKRTTAKNAKTEHGATAARWHAEYDISPQRLAECLIDGKAPAKDYRRHTGGSP